ncbi:HlyD family type I secretion periplasmic adaptor subunit [uncultured Tateyamaria sp.]|uniref:HlyD family type I secretion periplasmic adaptor subunit n=1 Tax=uncultured Tateyamaria sp. TaxID=455651 RepID=UPI0026106C74|nr:HlyD family type I secretion periplasmic adaptor subunit [uncultured Tateyamaria sp.]
MPEPQAPFTLRTSGRATALFGLTAFAGLLGVAGFWAGATEISGAVIGSGQVEVVGKPKSVQHLDGGLIDTIYVADGDAVQQGDVLLMLDDTLLRANIEIYKTRLSEGIAQRDRLIAEQAGMPQIDFETPDPMIEGIDFDVHRTGQEQVFDARVMLEKGRKEQLREKVRQFENQIAGVRALIEAKDQQLALVEDELGVVQTLMDKGLARAGQLLALQRNKADLLGQVAEHRSELARIQNSIRDTELEMLQGERRSKEEVVTELRDVKTSVQELRQQITSTQKQLDRIRIIAPNSGRIHEMQVTTIGGVVPPGGTILQIIPSDLGLTFRARIAPVSIDQVFVGQEATMRFPAFNQRTTPELYGHVSNVAANTSVDEVTGASYYQVTLALDSAQIARLGDVALVPGMPIEAFIKTDDRTVMSYLTKPLTEQLNRAFREE